MNNRTAYILGRCLGKMTADLGIEDRTALFSNAMHNPMSQITLLHLQRMPDFSEQLLEYLTAMLNQVETDEAIGDLSPEEQGAFTLGFEMGRRPFDVKSEIRARNITQQQLADKVGVARMTISRWLSEGIPQDRRTEAELTVYSLSGMIGNGYEYKTEENFMKKYTLTLIKAIADCEKEEGIVQDAILVHLNSDEFSDGDCIIFGTSYDANWTDEDIDDILMNESCPTYSTIRDDGVYIANA